MTFIGKKQIPPFQDKIPSIERLQNLKHDFYKYQNVIVSGSMVSWGYEWTTAFDLYVFIRLDNDIRMERLKQRELERYGTSLKTNKTICGNSKAFLEWANQYENPNFRGRSLIVHEEWMKQLESKVIRINGAHSLDRKADTIIKIIE